MKLIFICFSQKGEGSLDIRVMKLSKARGREYALREQAKPLRLKQFKMIWQGKCARYLEKPRESRN